jgi:hypothetical protein
MCRASTADGRVIDAGEVALADAAGWLMAKLMAHHSTRAPGTPSPS